MVEHSEVRGAYSYNYGLRNSNRKSNATLHSKLVTRDNDLPYSRPHGGEGDAAVQRVSTGSVSKLLAFAMTAYHVEVTCAPAGFVLMAEQAYSLSSGPTRTGWMDSCLQPGMGVTAGQ